MQPRGHARSYPHNPQHWFVHRYFCASEASDTSIPDWDGDPEWVDVETYDPYYRKHPTEVEAWAEAKGAECFIDIPCTSRNRKGEVFRVRTKTLSPASLRLYRELWDLPIDMRKQVESGKLPLLPVMPSYDRQCNRVHSACRVDSPMTRSLNPLPSLVWVGRTIGLQHLWVDSYLVY